MRYAQIVFDDERSLTRIVLVEDIKFKRSDKTCIKPSTDKDFIKVHKYYVKYYHCTESGDTCYENHEHEFDFYSAYIYALGNSIEELCESQKDECRMRFPNKKYIDSSSSTLSESSLHEKEQKENKKQAPKRIRKERLEDIIQQVKEQNKNLYNYFEDSNSESASDNETAPSKQKRSCAQNELLHSTNHDKSSVQSRSNTNNAAGNLLGTLPPSSTMALQEITNVPNAQPSSPLQPPLPSTGSAYTPKARQQLDAGDENHNDGNDDATAEKTSNNALQRLHVEHDQSDVNNYAVESHSAETQRDILHNHQATSTSTFRRTSEQDNEQRNEAANESHFHCKQWIDNLVAETFEYYINGDGKEEYTKRYTIVNGQTYLGLEILMDSIKWSILHSEKSPIKFVRMLAVKIWGSETLVNRAVVLNKVHNKNRIPGHSPVKELEREKLRLLISIFADYLQIKEKKLTVDQQVEYLRKTTTYISKKINEMKNALKKKQNGCRRLNL